MSANNSRQRRSDAQGNQSTEAGSSRSRQDDHMPEPSLPLTRQNGVVYAVSRNEVMDRHWPEEGCEQCVAKGIECKRPKGVSKQERCEYCQHKKRPCSLSAWLKGHLIKQYKTQRDSGTSVEEAELAVYGNLHLLGSRFDKHQTYSGLQSGLQHQTRSVSVASEPGRQQSPETTPATSGAASVFQQAMPPNLGGQSLTEVMAKMEQAFEKLQDNLRLPGCAKNQLVPSASIRFTQEVWEAFGRQGHFYVSD